mgnify:CR=1 FL=1
MSHRFWAMPANKRPRRPRAMLTGTGHRAAGRRVLCARGSRTLVLLPAPPGPDGPAAAGAVAAPAAAPSAPAAAPVRSGDRVFASPLARRLAAANGLELSQVSGTGSHGRIVKADVEKAKVEIPSMFDAGITSIAVDASHLPDDENLLASLELSPLVPGWASLETEVGEIKGKAYLVVDDWCIGYMKAVMLREDRWFETEADIFRENRWTQVMLGQGIVPEQYHPVVDVMGKDELNRFLANIKNRVDTTVSQLPIHDAYIEQYCRASPV